MRKMHLYLLKIIEKGIVDSNDQNDQWHGRLQAVAWDCIIIHRWYDIRDGHESKIVDSSKTPLCVSNGWTIGEFVGQGLVFCPSPTSCEIKHWPIAVEFYDVFPTKRIPPLKWSVFQRYACGRVQCVIPTFGDISLKIFLQRNQILCLGIWQTRVRIVDRVMAKRLQIPQRVLVIFGVTGGIELNSAVRPSQNLIFALRIIIDIFGQKFRKPFDIESNSAYEDLSTVSRLLVQFICDVMMYVITKQSVEFSIGYELIIRKVEIDLESFEGLLIHILYLVHALPNLLGRHASSTWIGIVQQCDRASTKVNKVTDILKNPLDPLSFSANDNHLLLTSTQHRQKLHESLGVYWLHDIGVGASSRVLIETLRVYLQLVFSNECHERRVLELGTSELEWENQIGSLKVNTML